MSNNGLTLTMVFLAESANYGEGIGNFTTLKKMTRGNYEQYSYISRQALRYSLMQQLEWDNTPVKKEGKVVQFAPSATIEDYPEIDLFGYMKTTGKAGGKKGDAAGEPKQDTVNAKTKKNDQKGDAATRSAVVRLSNAIALEPYQSDLEFLTNMGLAQRDNLENTIAQSEIHRSYYAYTVSIDLNRVGVDGDKEIAQDKKAERVKKLLEGLQYLYRDIKGRRENLSPLFVIGGRYQRKNPFFENRVIIDNNKLKIETLEEIINSNEDIKDNTLAGVAANIFDNSDEIQQMLKATTVGEVFKRLKEEVDKYYGESN